MDNNIRIYRYNLLKNKGTIKYSILAKIDLFFSSFFRKMIKWADVVYIPRLWFSVIPFVKFYGKPVVVHLHDYIPSCPLSKAFWESITFLNQAFVWACLAAHSLPNCLARVWVSDDRKIISLPV